MKNLITSLLLMAAIATVTACDKDEDKTPANTKNLSGTMSSAQVIPAIAVVSTAIGNATATYDMDKNILNYNVTYSGLTGSPVACHFHIGAPGVKGAVAFAAPNLPTTPSGTITDTSVPLTQSQEVELLKGNFYVNMHTNANKDGEIRGNITVK